MVDLLLIFLSVLGFGLQHSGLSALPIKYRIIDRWGKLGYSRLYSITSAIMLIFPLLLVGIDTWLYLVFNPGYIFLPWVLGGIGFIVISGIIGLKALAVIDISTVADMRTDRKPALITTGIYRYIRHPLYFALVIAFVGLLLIFPFANVAVFSLSLLGYLLVGAYLEEQKLVRYYGDEYLTYRKQAGFLIPRIRQKQGS